MALSSITAWDGTTNMDMPGSTDRDYLRKREIEEREAAANAVDGAKLAHLELAKLYAIRLGREDSETLPGVVGGSDA